MPLGEWPSPDQLRMPLRWVSAHLAVLRDAASGIQDHAARVEAHLTQDLDAAGRVGLDRVVTAVHLIERLQDAAESCQKAGALLGESVHQATLKVYEQRLAHMEAQHVVAVATAAAEAANAVAAAASAAAAAAVPPLPRGPPPPTPERRLSPSDRSPSPLTPPTVPPPAQKEAEKAEAEPVAPEEWAPEEDAEGPYTEGPPVSPASPRAATDWYLENEETCSCNGSEGPWWLHRRSQWQPAAEGAAEDEEEVTMEEESGETVEVERNEAPRPRPQAEAEAASEEGPVAMETEEAKPKPSEPPAEDAFRWLPRPKAMPSPRPQVQEKAQEPQAAAAQPGRTWQEFHYGTASDAASERGSQAASATASWWGQGGPAQEPEWINGGKDHSSGYKLFIGTLEPSTRREQVWRWFPRAHGVVCYSGKAASNTAYAVLAFEELGDAKKAYEEARTWRWLTVRWWKPQDRLLL